MHVRQLTTGDDGEECENRDRGSSLEPGERQPPSSSLSEGCGMTSSGSGASGMRRRSRRMRRRSCTLALWAAKSTNCSGIGCHKVSARGRASKQDKLACVWSLDGRMTSRKDSEGELRCPETDGPWTVHPLNPSGKSRGATCNMMPLVRQSLQEYAPVAFPYLHKP